MSNDYYIYAHFTKDTNELFYIGVGKGRRAWKNGRNKYWKNIVAKHGYIIHIILDGFTYRDEAVKEEVRLQILNKPRACLVYGDRYNQIISNETRNKMRISAKNNTSHLGHTHTQETREKLRQYNLGKKLTKDHKQKIKAAGLLIQNNLLHRNKGVINCKGEIFDSRSIAAKYYNMKTTSNIGECCSGKRATAGKYVNGVKIKWSNYVK